MLDKEKIIQTVAQKHGILLGDDDPILAFLSVHDVLLDDYLDRFDRTDANHREQIEHLLDRFAVQTTKVIETALGRERERFRNDLQSLLATERKAHRGRGGDAVPILLWSIIVVSVLLSSLLAFFLFT